MKHSRLLALILFMLGGALALYLLWSYISFSHPCSDAANGPVCVSDQAISTKSLAACNVLAEEKDQEQCLLKAIPPLAINEAACGDIILERGKNICLDYVKKMVIAKNKPLPQTYRHFEFEQKTLNVTFVDGTKKNFTAYLADTDDKQLQGLSYRRELKDNEAMLFVHPTPKKATYHMKDMLFSIDMVYLSKEGNVINTYRSLPSCVVYTGECALYGSSNSEVKYVLEILPQGKDIQNVEIVG